MIMTKLDDLQPILIGLVMSFKILRSTTSRPIFFQLITTGGKSGELGNLVPGKFSSLAGNRDGSVKIERDMMMK